jgi:hypothetical protein
MLIFFMALQLPVVQGLSIIKAFTIKLRNTTLGGTPLGE